MNLRCSDLPEDVYQILTTRWPQFAERHSFKVSLPSDSSELCEILSFLEANGFSSNWLRYPTVKRNDTGRFQLSGLRIFDNEELDVAPYLHVVPEDEIAVAGGHQDDGRIFVKSRSIIKRVPFGRVFGSSTSVCSDTFRHQLEAEAFSHLVFRDLQNAGSVIWQLWSDLHLPQMLNLFFDDNDPNYGLMINDLFYPPIPRFRTSEFKAVPEFDFAITEDRIGGGAERSRDPLLIISQRVRKFLDGLGIKNQYIPIKTE